MIGFLGIELGDETILHGTDALDIGMKRGHQNMHWRGYLSLHLHLYIMGPDHLKAKAQFAHLTSLNKFHLSEYIHIYISFETHRISYTTLLVYARETQPNALLLMLKAVYGITSSLLPR